MYLAVVDGFAVVSSRLVGLGVDLLVGTGRSEICDVCESAVLANDVEGVSVPSTNRIT